MKKGLIYKILDMTENEAEMLATHLGHDPKTHKENYRLTHSTRELSVVSQLLLLVESGAVNTCKGKKLSENPIEQKLRGRGGPILNKIFFGKKFHRYLKRIGQVHKDDLIHCQNISDELSKRSLAQIRTKLNNMKLGKS